MNSCVIHVCNCFDDLHEKGLIYTIFIDLVIRYIVERKAIRLEPCDCCRCRSIYQMIYELESQECLKIMESSDKEILVIPQGVDISEKYMKGVLVCICGKNE